jgi:hypothetical protein
MKNLSHLAMFLAAVLALASSALGQQAQGPDTLVTIVRNATQQYANPLAATGYSPVLGCVSGPDHGAMGIHYLNNGLLYKTITGPIDPTKPQALIYEPQSNGQLQLVGVEFIILATALPANSAPEVDGHLMNYIDAPNRYGISVPFFELHVWAWRDNPQGPFVDWNNHVTCAHQ